MIITNANKESKSSVSFFYVILLRISIDKRVFFQTMINVNFKPLRNRKIVKYTFIKVSGSFLKVKENALDYFTFIKQIKVNRFQFFFRSEKILFPTLCKCKGFNVYSAICFILI